MSDFSETWSLTRKRFEALIVDLNQDQLNWRLHPGSLTIGESALHVVGVEVSFVRQLLGEPTEGFEERLRQSATNGVVNENPFPFVADEITPELVLAALELGAALTGPVIEDPDPYRARTIKSALGPMVDGTGTFARLAYHPGYHQAQAQMIRTAPGFPA